MHQKFEKLMQKQVLITWWIILHLIFKIKTRYYLEIETTGTIKLLGSTKNEITKDKNGENIPNLEITDVVLIHGSVVNNDYQHDWISLYAFVQNKIFGQLLDI